MAFICMHAALSPILPALQPRGCGLRGRFRMCMCMHYAAAAAAAAAAGAMVLQSHGSRGVSKQRFGYVCKKVKGGAHTMTHITARTVARFVLEIKLKKSSNN